MASVTLIELTEIWSETLFRIEQCTIKIALIINSLAPGRSGFNFKSAIFNLVVLIGIFRSAYDNALR